MDRSNTYKPSSIFILLTVTSVVTLCCQVAIAEGHLKFVSVKPTVFFINEGDIVTQLGEVTIENSSEQEKQFNLQTQIPDRRMKDITAIVPKGKTTIEFNIPNINKSEQVTFILKVEGEEQDRHSMTWQPQRK